MADINILIAAINNRTQLRFRYGGHVRVISPHEYGTKNGRHQFLGVQTGGTSSSGLSENLEDNWRCIHLDEVDGDFEIDETAWQTATNHSRPNTCVDEVIATCFPGS